MTKENRDKYLELLAEYYKVTNAQHWDREKQNDLAKRMAQLVNRIDTLEVIELQMPEYERLIR